jgi:phenylacetic acid degradation operon negative regulatory protein
VPYTGTWSLAVVTTAGSTAEVRTARRRALAYVRLAELREGVWMRPDNVAVTLPDEVTSDIELMQARPVDPQRLADLLWDVRAWADRADGLLAGLAALAPDTPDALAPGFELSAAVLRHLQADPLLPEDLLPARWPGTRLRAVYDDWDARYRTTLRAWSRT